MWFGWVCAKLQLQLNRLVRGLLPIKLAADKPAGNTPEHS